MIRTILFIIIGLIVLILSFPFAVIIWLFSKKGNFDPVSKAGVFCVQKLAKIYCKLAGCDLEIIGAENIPKGAAVFAGNHQGNFDTLIVQYALGSPVITMAKKEAAYIPIANIWMVIAHLIFVDRKNIKRAANAYKTSLEYLRHGFPVLYFPEGTRSHGPQMGSFKAGAFKAAVSEGVPLVPFAVDGTYHVYEETGHMVKSKVYLSVLPPIPVTKEDSPKELSEKTKAAIQSELDRLRQL